MLVLHQKVLWMKSVHASRATLQCSNFLWMRVVWKQQASANVIMGWMAWSRSHAEVHRSAETCWAPHLSFCDLRPLRVRPQPELCARMCVKQSACNYIADIIVSVSLKQSVNYPFLFFIIPYSSVLALCCVVWISFFLLHIKTMFRPSAWVVRS